MPSTQKEGKGWNSAQRTQRIRRAMLKTGVDCGPPKKTRGGRRAITHQGRDVGMQHVSVWRDDQRKKRVAKACNQGKSEHLDRPRLEQGSRLALIPS